MCARWLRLIAVVLPIVLAAGNSSSHVQAEDHSPRTIKAHRKLVRWVGYSPDGKSLATASFDGSLQIRDAASGELKMPLAGHLKKAYWGSFSNDGRTFASGGEDAVVRVWQLDTGRVRKELRGHLSAAWTGVVTPDGSRIVSGGTDSMVFVWDITLGKAERSFRHSAPIWWLDVSSDSRFIAVTSDDGKVTLYNLATGQEFSTFGDHKGGIFCVEISADDRLIATAGADGRAKIWSSENGELMHTLPQFGAVYTVAFSPNGNLLATGGADYSVRLWNVDKGTFRSKHTGHTDDLWTVAFSPDGSHLASAGSDGNLLVWKVDHQAVSKREELPLRVDLRPMLKKYGLQIVAQQSRDTSSVQTFTRALEFAISKRDNRGLRLSDEYLSWACNQVIGNTGPEATDRGQFFEQLWMGYCKHGICSASTMPFQSKFDPALSPSAEAARSATAIKRSLFEWHDVSGPGVTDEKVVAQAKSVLAKGWPLLAGATHSLFVVGYQDEPEGGYFLVADSGTGQFIDKVTSDRLHSAISYSRVKDYVFSWIECIPSSMQPR